METGHKFTTTATEQEPVNEISKMFYHLQKVGLKGLSRKEKDDIFQRLYGMGNHGGSYKIAGWSYPFYKFLKRFVVSRYDSAQWETCYSPDKTAIRNNTYTRTGINEIHEIPNLIAD